MSDELPEPPRQVAHFALLILVGFLIAGSFVLSGRPVMLASLPHIAFVADVPRHRHEDQLATFTAVAGALLPKTDWRPPIAVALGKVGEVGTVRPKLGYWVRSWTFLGLPMFAVTEGGYAVYLDRPGYYRAVPLGEGGEAELIRQTGGRRFWGSWLWSYWRHCWGLLAPIGVAVFAWAEFRWQAKRRAILGLI